MSKKQILINKEGGQVRVALLSEGRLVNVEIEGGGASSIKGDVYKARVTSVNTSFQAAFLQFGGTREGFLSVQDLSGDLLKGHGSHPRLEKVLKPGNELLVQVTKDPIDQKGASMTTAVSLPGRFLVLVPGGSRLGVSKKLPDEHRSRLKEMMSGVEIPEGFGVITRTAAVNVTRKQDLVRDMTQLVRLWNTIKAKSEATRAPALLFRDQGVAIRFLREYFTDASGNHLMLPSNNVAYEREAYWAVDGFDESYPLAAAEDFDLSYRIVERGYRQRYFEPALVWHHHRNTATGYLRQQFRYGKGTFDLRRRRYSINDLAGGRGGFYPKLMRFLRRRRAPWGVWFLILLTPIAHRCGVEARRFQAARARS